MEVREILIGGGTTQKWKGAPPGGGDHPVPFVLSLFLAVQPTAIQK